MSLLLLAAAAAAASPNAMQNDVQCLALYASALGSAKDNDIRMQAMAGVMYFYGRIERADQSADFTALLRAEADRLGKTPEDAIKAIGAGCDERVRKAGRQLQDTGAALTKK